MFYQHLIMKHPLLFDYYFDRYTHVEDYLVAPKIQYMAVGSAVELQSKNIMLIHEKNNRQFPNFLRQIMNTHNVPVRIILIDPQLEMPPNIVTAEQFGTVCKWEESKYFSNVYYCPKIKLEVIGFRTRIDYHQHLKYLQLYNFHCLKRSNLFFFHDFSWFDTARLADHFDKYLGENQKHIMYDITFRQDDSRYPNLLVHLPVIKKELYVMKYGSNPGIRFYIYNPYSFKHEEMYDLFQKANEKEKLQIQECIKHKISMFFKTDYPTFKKDGLNSQFCDKMKKLVLLLPENSSEFLAGFHKGLDELKTDTGSMKKWMNAVQKHLLNYFDKHYQIKSL